MSVEILRVLGGLGLFLIGMKIMTEALRDAAGPRLRHVLTRFTTTPLRGALTGLGATALIQSSSATTVMTVGFVGAGVMTFSQALGVLYGANIGTTVTGWVVAFIGLKLQIGLLAQPLLFASALTMLLGHGRVVRIARGLAGISMLFIGLDQMQGASALVGDWLTPDDLPGDTLGGRLTLIALGFVMVNVLQSSSAGMAITLVLLGEGALTFAQAAALVIGLNLGTTVTALLAAVGGARAMRQTAMANMLFNLGTALMAVPLLDLVAPVLHHTGLGSDDLTALVLFHTGFNLVGALVFLPLTSRFAALIEWLFKPAGASLTEQLDLRLLTEPEAALIAAEASTDALQVALFGALGAALAPQPDLRALSTLPQQVPQAQDQLEDYLARIRLPEGQPALHDRLAGLLHRLDHAQRLATRIERRTPLTVIEADPRLRRAALALGARLRAPETTPADLERLATLIERRTSIYRELTLRQRRVGESVQDLFDRTDAMRWLARLADHAARLARKTP